MQHIKDKIRKYFPESMVKAVNEKGGFFVAGGFFTSMVTRNEINDIDIYFRNKESLVEFIRYIKDDNHWCTFISDKTLNYSVGDDKYQLIYYDYYSSLQEVFNSFDFTISMAGWDSVTDKIEMDENFMLHNSQRYLCFNTNTKFPLISCLRIQKFKERGYYIPKNQFVKMMINLTKLDINDWEEFKSHTGSLYGLNYIKDSLLADKEFSIENAIEVIENTNFEGNSTTEYKIDPRIVDVCLSGEPVKYVEFDGNIFVVGDYDDHGILTDLVENGSIKSEKISVKDYLGQYLYKWVNTDLTSNYKSDFVYDLNKWIEPSNPSRFCKNSEVLFFTTKDEIKNHYFKNKERVILKCEYNEDDVVDVRNKREVMVKKVYPVAVVEEGYL